jgi:hypothetical protein
MLKRYLFCGFWAGWRVFITVFIICTIFTTDVQAGVLNAEQVLRLQKAGAGKDLIVHIIESQAIARALVSFDDLVAMKEGGVSDEIIIGIIDAGNPTAKELAKQDAYDRRLLRHIQRQREIILLQRERQEALVDFLSKLIHNNHLQELVSTGKISGDDYRRIVKYLKQYAKDEPTYEWDDEGDIDIEITK